MALKNTAFILSLLLILMVAVSCTFLTMTPFPRELMKLEDFVDLEKVLTYSDYHNDDVRLLPVDKKLFLWVRGYEGQMDRILAFNEKLDLQLQVTGDVNNIFMKDQGEVYVVGNIQFNPALDAYGSVGNPGFLNAYPWAVFDSYDYYYYRMEVTGDPAQLYYTVDDNTLSTLSSDYITLGSDLYNLYSVTYDPDPAYGSGPAVCLIINSSYGYSKAFLLELSKLRNSVYTSLGFSSGEEARSLYLPNSEDWFYAYARDGVVCRQDGKYYLYTFDQKIKILSDTQYYNQNFKETYDARGEYFYRFYHETRRLTKSRVWWQ